MQERTEKQIVDDKVARIGAWGATSTTNRSAYMAALERQTSNMPQTGIEQPKETLRVEQPIPEANNTNGNTQDGAQINPVKTTIWAAKSGGWRQ